MIRYQHRQFAKEMSLGMGIGGLLCMSTTALLPQLYLIPLLTGLILVIAAYLFSSLTIEIDDQWLSWKFGPGLIRKQIPLAEISDVEITRTRIWEGWGIHLTSRGWLYNVSGFDAVLIRQANGKQFMLGTDQPQQLSTALART